MTCLICKQGRTQPGHATVRLDRNGCKVVIEDVPADVCDNCGEDYLSEDMTATVLERAETAAANGAEVELIRYVA